MKPSDGNAHTLSAGNGILQEFIIFKNVYFIIQVLAQHILAQFPFPQAVILSQQRRICAQVNKARVRQICIIHQTVMALRHMRATIAHHSTVRREFTFQLRLLKTPSPFQEAG